MRHLPHWWICANYKPKIQGVLNIAYYLDDQTVPATFEKQLLWFKSHYHLVLIHGLREHIYGSGKLNKTCMLSVDDGWHSTYDVIFHIMKKHNVPFTVFVSPEVYETGKHFWYCGSLTKSVNYSRQYS